jgi:hypothetical protein
MKNLPVSDAGIIFVACACLFFLAVIFSALCKSLKSEYLTYEIKITFLNELSREKQTIICSQFTKFVCTNNVSIMSKNLRIGDKLRNGLVVSNFHLEPAQWRLDTVQWR